MSIRAGSIVTVAGRNVVDRLQTAGLTNAQVPVETIREIGNDLVVDKIPTEADFTFSMESWDVSCDLMAWLHGKMGDQVAADGPAAADAAGTQYRWEDCQYVHITSPWKADTGNQGGHIGAGIVIPGYYPTRMTYRFGITDWATQTVEISGGSYYYATTPPVEEVATADGVVTDFVTSESARAHRIGGAGGSTYRYVLGVIMNGVLQVEGSDYTVSVAPTVPPASGVATISFAVAPPNGAQVKFVYFTEVAKAYPQAVNADTTVKPGAVRGRDIDLLVGTRGTDQVKLPGVQTFELNATIQTTVERELGNDQPTGRSVEGTDATGTVTIRPKDIPALFDALSRVTGVAAGEVFGYLNQNDVPVEAVIHDPKDRGTVLKTLYVSKGLFQPPPTPARVNQPTDFAMQFDSADGSFSEFKGARP